MPNCVIELNYFQTLLDRNPYYATQGFEYEDKRLPLNPDRILIDPPPNVRQYMADFNLDAKTTFRQLLASMVSTCSLPEARPGYSTTDRWAPAIYAYLRKHLEPKDWIKTMLKRVPRRLTRPICHVEKITSRQILHVKWATLSEFVHSTNLTEFQLFFNGTDAGTWTLGEDAMILKTRGHECIIIEDEGSVTNLKSYYFGKTEAECDHRMDHGVFFHMLDAVSLLLNNTTVKCKDAAQKKLKNCDVELNYLQRLLGKKPFYEKYGFAYEDEPVMSDPDVPIKKPTPAVSEYLRDFQLSDTITYRELYVSLVQTCNKEEVGKAYAYTEGWANYIYMFLQNRLLPSNRNHTMQKTNVHGSPSFEWRSNGILRISM